MRKRVLALSGLLALAGCGAASDNTAPAPSGDVAEGAQTDAAGCGAQETTIFACRLDNGKRAAVCAPQGGEAEYRYGGPPPELALKGATWANAAYSGGGESQIAFVEGDTRHIVFSRMVRTSFTAGEPNDPAIADGVVIETGGRFGALHLCSDPGVTPVDYAAAEARIGSPAGELFTEETIRADRPLP